MVILRAGFCKLLREIDSWMQELGRICPSSIKVDTKNIATVVAVNNSVRVQHRHYLENEQFTESLSLFAAELKYKVNDALDHK